MTKRTNVWFDTNLYAAHQTIPMAIDHADSALPRGAMESFLIAAHRLSPSENHRPEVHTFHLLLADLTQLREDRRMKMDIALTQLIRTLERPALCPESEQGALPQRLMLENATSPILRPECL